MDRPRVVIADDHAETRQRVARLLEPEFEVVRSVADGQELISAVSELKPDAAIVDITMPVINGIEATRRLKNSESTTKIVFLTIHPDSDFLSEALSAGALGYVVKSRLASDLIPAIYEALSNRSFVSSF